MKKQQNYPGYNNYRKKNSIYFILLINLIFVTRSSYGQTSITIKDATLTTTNTWSYNTITILPNTVIAPAAGQTIRFTALPNVCLSLNNNNLSTTQNYIATSVPRVPGYTGNTTGYTACDVMQTVEYIDGLGRPLQTVQVKGGTNTRTDVVQPFTYDAYGREATKYLPYTTASNDGSYKADALNAGSATGQNSFYVTPTPLSGVSSISIPSAATVFEPSPLNRATEQGATGATWQPSTTTADHTVHTVYASNDGSIYWARQYSVTLDPSTSAATLTNSGNYPAGKLYVKVIMDENWISGRPGTTEEYKDMLGHIVLKRTFDDSATALSTYYVYDDLGNLTFVLPPGATPDIGITSAANQDILNKFCYQYQYDDRNRQVEKHIPGKGAEYTVFNINDQVVATQDAIQRGKTTQEWSFTKYDGLGRIAFTGIYQYPNSVPGTNYRTALQSSVNTQATLWETPIATGIGYTSAAWPIANITRILTLNFYDNYNYPNSPYNPTVSNTLSTPTGLLTATKTAVLLPDLTYGAMLWTVHFYDDKGREVQTYQQHYLGGEANVNPANYDETAITYNFNDQAIQSIRHHYTSSGGTPVLALTASTTYSYDHMGRKTDTKEAIASGGNALPAPTVLSSLVYNEVGQLLTKKLHNGLQTTAYTYNERGWLKSQTSNEFSMELRYQDAINGMQPQFNGNITNQIYTNLAGNTFNYTYDKLNRLTSGTATGMSEVLSYDVMGNIYTLSRDGGPTGTYSNDGNRLTQIIGGPLATGLYSYDDNGNVKYDGRTGKGITNNLLNLPATVDGGLTYIYSASGEKLHKTSVGPTTTTNIDYIDGIQYTNGTIEFIQTDEGLARKNGDNYSYEYNLKDHLGNVRATFYQNPSDGSIKVFQRDDYYAFGLQKVVTPNTNKYLYNGKELQDELGQYDYGARFYDPVIGRWNVPDELAEEFENASPYAYVLNNPINTMDPDGRDTLKEVFINAPRIKPPEIAPPPLPNIEPPKPIRTGPLPGFGPKFAGLGLFVYLMLSPANSLSDHSEKDALDRINTIRAAREHRRFRTKHGELTNGKYRVTKGGMSKHVFGGVEGKSMFYPTLDPEEAVLKAAEYADENSLWVGDKAKVPVSNTDVGTTGLKSPTNVINVYRNQNGTIHGSPGNP